ncbi:methyltransferase domain-containing protein [Riemerella columbina]|uniref:methyltransferase domain-containing protein n=1 Tax=Riemerella columbina TaxID=103810 RepID=UPI000381E66F|nr:methyltransferase domain-containing protein [Riemerella columbina]
MVLNRTKYQGVCNIIRFNWHMYIIALIFIVFLLFLSAYFSSPYAYLFYFVAIGILFSLLISLMVSWYIYDRTNLYELPWLPVVANKTILNIHAGFDEISSTLQEKFANSNLTICDFYDEEKHTEISIKRARKMYHNSQQTLKIETTYLPFENHRFDCIVLFFAAHEIRNHAERIQFFSELYRVLQPKGSIYVTEHLRDWKNFLVYNLGFFHFYSKQNWMVTFKKSNLKVDRTINQTPFITTFQLIKNDSSN